MDAKSEYDDIRTEFTDFAASNSYGSLVDDVLSGLINREMETAGTYAPMLISNRPGSETMIEALGAELSHSDAFDMSVAFVSTGAIQMLYQDFLNHRLRTSGKAFPSRIITSTKNYFNDPKVFWQLLHLQETGAIEVRVWDGPYTQQGRDAIGAAFHPKGYIFSHRMNDGQPYINLYVGSSNLTSQALTTQREWNLRISSLASGELVEQVHEEIDSQVADSHPLTDEWIRQYEEDFKKYAPPRRELLEKQRRRKITPNGMQREALVNLRRLRNEGEHRAIIVSATGTGKTYLSAFDVKAYFEERKKHGKSVGRVLYVAQQQQILTAARKSYQKVLECNSGELGLFSGTSKESDKRIVFATVQTLSRPEILESFAADEFDYILFDEVHHAGAPTYQRVIDHFQGADFMLGMTATPERFDGINVFALFGYNIAYEIRLQKALDEGMLCPFHYYGIAEYLGNDDNGKTQRIDANGKKGSGGKQLAYEIAQLATEERVDYIIDKLREYGVFHVPVTGLVFCSTVEEAQRLSELFNDRFNQQAERNYRTAAVTGRNSQRERDDLVERLANGDLDYLFTVDLFNEGIDIPPVNQIVMLRNTQSSIVFTQQLGRGLRKFPAKESCTVIDFIGNYSNSYLIPVALYGNTGNRDMARRNLQRKTIGLSSISFDHIAKERVLKSLDTADWTEMRRLAEQYRIVRYELGRIPMLVDIYRYDPSLPFALASKKGNYLEFVHSREKSIGRGHDGEQASFLDTLEDVSPTAEGMLKMATDILLPGLRPQELVILRLLCGLDEYRDVNEQWNAPKPLSRAMLEDEIRRRYPLANCSVAQFDSAMRVLTLDYFIEANKRRFGSTPLVTCDGRGQYRLTDELEEMLRDNHTFRAFFFDTVRTGLLNCTDLIMESASQHRSLDGAFVYGHPYTLWDVMRLCGWEKEQVPQNVGGYRVDVETGTMPIFIKYAASQYEDRFLNRQEIRWYSKNMRSLHSPEFAWIRQGEDSDWPKSHNVPIFVMRAAEAKEGLYYFIGSVGQFIDMEDTVKPANTDKGSVSVVLSTLQLKRPVDLEMYRHLTGMAE